MPDFQQEIAALALADRHIMEGEMRITKLAERARNSKEAGWDTASAEQLLKLMQEILAQWHVHRQIILETIDRCSR